MTMYKEQDRSRRYDDIINLPHPVSATHPQMSISDRAAQFSPFAALTGYDAAVKETARLTDEKIELDESRKLELNEKLMLLQECLQTQPAVKITFFKHDQKKAGGVYVSVTGNVKKIDRYEGTVVMADGSSILADDIYEVESDIFACLEEG